jgi:hypothetical protein
MRFAYTILILSLAATGCVSRSKARMNQENAYLAGQNQILRQQLAQQQAQDAAPSVTVIGPVQNGTVPWVAGLTLAQAVATANYLDANPPQKIILTRQGDSATLDAHVLLNGPDVPLENGDIIELRQ